ncbi:hypothetical protein QE152_g29829 [Popillia japonica]|uniref:Uncharacterized protein n=1 Tax=Popillia japonica TaxID=7064 RepID=A0AAW1JGY7_POPJA
MILVPIPSPLASKQILYFRIMNCEIPLGFVKFFEQPPMNNPPGGINYREHLNITHSVFVTGGTGKLVKPTQRKVNNQRVYTCANMASFSWLYSEKVFAYFNFCAGSW